MSGYSISQISRFLTPGLGLKSFSELNSYGKVYMQDKSDQVPKISDSPSRLSVTTSSTASMTKAEFKAKSDTLVSLSIDQLLSSQNTKLQEFMTGECGFRQGDDFIVFANFSPEKMQLSDINEKYLVITKSENLPEKAKAYIDEIAKFWNADDIMKNSISSRLKFYEIYNCIIDTLIQERGEPLTSRVTLNWGGIDQFILDLNRGMRFVVQGSPEEQEEQAALEKLMLELRGVSDTCREGATTERDYRQFIKLLVKIVGDENVELIKHGFAQSLGGYMSAASSSYFGTNPLDGLNLGVIKSHEDTFDSMQLTTPHVFTMQLVLTKGRKKLNFIDEESLMFGAGKKGTVIANSKITYSGEVNHFKINSFLTDAPQIFLKKNASKKELFSLVKMPVRQEQDIMQLVESIESLSSQKEDLKQKIYHCDLGLSRYQRFIITKKLPKPLDRGTLYFTVGICPDRIILQAEDLPPLRFGEEAQNALLKITKENEIITGRRVMKRIAAIKDLNSMQKLIESSTSYDGLKSIVGKFLTQQEGRNLSDWILIRRNTIGALFGCLLITQDDVNGFIKSFKSKQPFVQNYATREQLINTGSEFVKRNLAEYMQTNGDVIFIVPEKSKDGFLVLADFPHKLYVDTGYAHIPYQNTVTDEAVILLQDQQIKQEQLKVFSTVPYEAFKRIVKNYYRGLLAALNETELCYSFSLEAIIPSLIVTGEKKLFLDLQIPVHIKNSKDAEETLILEPVRVVCEFISQGLKLIAGHAADPNIFTEDKLNYKAMQQIINEKLKKQRYNKLAIMKALEDDVTLRRAHRAATFSQNLDDVQDVILALIIQEILNLKKPLWEKLKPQILLLFKTDITASMDDAAIIAKLHELAGKDERASSITTTMERLTKRVGTPQSPSIAPQLVATTSPSLDKKTLDKKSSSLFGKFMSFTSKTESKVKPGRFKNDHLVYTPLARLLLFLNHQQAYLRKCYLGKACRKFFLL